MSISVVCIGINNEGNLGAICRSMKNFDLKDLILINPQCKIDDEALKRAMHAKDVLKKAKIKPLSYLKQFHTVIATTSKIGTDYNIPRSPITPEQLAKKVKISKKIAIVFGTEDRGLTNKELTYADFIVTIPTSKKYPALNLSHAATIIFYELFKARATEHVSSHIVYASKTEKYQIMKNINQVLNKLKFATTSKKKTQKVIWKRILGKSFLTKREAYALIGFFKKLK